jgi:hypothetical protein
VPHIRSPTLNGLYLEGRQGSTVLASAHPRRELDSPTHVDRRRLCRHAPRFRAS